MDKVFQDKAVDASKPLYHPAPVFPAGAIHDRVTGTPIVAVVVGIGGRPEQVLLDVSSGDDRLDQAAQDAAAQWIFRPNVSKPFKVRIPFTFALTQAES
jgi:TonB family protein